MIIIKNIYSIETWEVGEVPIITAQFHSRSYYFQK